LRWYRTLPLGASDRRFSDTAGLAIYRQAFQLLGFIGLGHHPGMQREPGCSAHPVIERLIASRQRLLGKHLAVLLRADSDAVRDR
jgi:hypothetical protein